MRAKALMACVFVATLGVAGCNSVPNPMNMMAAPASAAPPAPRVAPPPLTAPAPGRVVTNPLPAPTTSSAASSTPPIIASLAPPTDPGVIGGAIGQTLSEKDRAAAIAAQQEAVASGQRKSWRGERGAYGFVVPGPESGSCRDYTHRIFINGRPKEAKGQACRQDGEWRVTG